jgi:hypothetical protein
MKAWNIFDTVVVSSALIEEFLTASSNVTAIRVLRILRLVRVLRIFRTFRMFKDLRSMVKGIFTSLISLVWAIALLIIMFFVVGIFITQVVTSYRKENHFSGVEGASLDPLLESNFGSAPHNTLYK